MKAFLAICGLAAAGAVAAWSMPGDAFDPVDFFEGRSHGEGTLHQLLKGDKHVRVDSVGRVVKGGVLVLDQTVAVAGEKARHRRWQLRPSGDGWTGTLTDADNAVAVTRDDDDSIRIRYKMDGGLKVEQVLTPRPGGKTVDNEMKIRKFGIVVATLDETIVKH